MAFAVRDRCVAMRRELRTPCGGSGGIANGGVGCSTCTLCSAAGSAWGIDGVGGVTAAGVIGTVCSARGAGLDKPGGTAGVLSASAGGTPGGAAGSRCAAGTLCSAEGSSGGSMVGLKTLAIARRAAVAVTVASTKGWRAFTGMCAVMEMDVRVSFRSVICACRSSAMLDPGMR